jgi:tRNA(Ile)-lysidine synthase
LKPWCKRNLLRLDVLPRLQSEFNSNLNATLLRTADIFREEENFWESLLQDWLTGHSQVIEGDQRGVGIPLEPLRETHPAMQKRLLRRTVEKIKGDLRGFSFHHTEILLQLCRSPAANRQIDLPGGVKAEKSYGWLTITMHPRTGEDFHYEIASPGDHALPLLNHRLLVERVSSYHVEGHGRNSTEAIMDLDHVSFPLVLRSYKPGDRFRPLGLGGSKKLKDFFIDAKIPRNERWSIPILCSRDRIIWVVGHRLDDRVKVTGKSKRLVRLRYLGEAE